MTFAEPLPHISSVGHLLDGQPRLGAVVRASVTVPMIVVSNIPPEKAAAQDRNHQGADAAAAAKKSRAPSPNTIQLLLA
jgi:hypothetical protein